MERAVEAGTLASAAGDGGLRRATNRAAAVRTRHEQAAAGRHLHAHVLRDCAASRIRRARSIRRSGEAENGASSSTSATGPDQLCVAHRGARHQGRISARRHFDRHARGEHERRHERHAQRDEQVSRARPSVRRGDPADDVERRSRDPAGGARPLSVGANADVAVWRIEKGNFGLVDGSGTVSMARSGSLQS